MVRGSSSNNPRAIEKRATFESVGCRILLPCSLRSPRCLFGLYKAKLVELRETDLHERQLAELTKATNALNDIRERRFEAGHPRNVSASSYMQVALRAAWFAGTLGRTSWRPISVLTYDSIAAQNPKHIKPRRGTNFPFPLRHLVLLPLSSALRTPRPLYE